MDEPSFFSNEGQRKRVFLGHLVPLRLQRPLPLEVCHVYLHEASPLLGLAHPPQAVLFFLPTPLFLQPF